MSYDKQMNQSTQR